MAEYLNRLTDKGYQLLWQCGPRYFETYEFYESERVRVTSFIERMDLAYSLCDAVISRSGAGAVSELAILGKPTLFIPSPNVAEDHQTKNALALTEVGAALLLREADMNRDTEMLLQQLVDEVDQPSGMGDRFKESARPHAAQEIVELIKEILHER
jgi:UDP-N-acetylglucosamine--N-acetylmuramyl-(pentapeptide) pyrophosphoryl-undecaprenol N-acetylglucosamine transferase